MNDRKTTANPSHQQRGWLSAVLPAFLALWAIQFLTGMTVRNPLTLVLFAALLLLFRNMPGKLIWIHLAAALFASLTLYSEGGRITAAFTSGLFRVASLGICAIGLFLLYDRLLSLAAGVLMSDSMVSAVKTPGKHEFVHRHVLLCVFLLLVILWFPYYLYEYPGILSPDGIVQLEQVLGVRPWNNHHPVLHTLLMALFFRVGSLFSDNVNAAVSCYTFAQLLFHAFSCAALVSLITKLSHISAKDTPSSPTISPRQSAFNSKPSNLSDMNVSDVSHRILHCLPAAAVLYYALFPYHAVYAVYAGKDTPFTDITLLFLIVLTHLILPETGFGKVIDRILFIITGLLFCLLRTNGWYAFLFLTPALLIYGWLLDHRSGKCDASESNARRRLVSGAFLSWLWMCVLVIAVSSLVRGPVYDRAGVERSDFVESLCVPLQQLGRTVTEGGALTEEDQRTLSEFINRPEDISLVYDPVFADMMKEIVRTNGSPEWLEQHKGEFFSLWLRVGLRNPGSYLRAYADLTRAYWYPDVEYEMAIIDGVAPNSMSFAWTPHLHSRLFVKWKEIVLKLGTFVPLYGLVWSMGFCFWILIFGAALILTARQSRRLLLILLPGLALYLTLFLASPVAEYRYGYPMLAALPFWIIVPLLATPETALRSHLQ